MKLRGHRGRVGVWEVRRGDKGRVFGILEEMTKHVSNAGWESETGYARALEYLGNTGKVLKMRNFIYICIYLFIYYMHILIWEGVWEGRREEDNGKEILSNLKLMHLAHGRLAYGRRKRNGVDAQSCLGISIMKKKLVYFHTSLKLCLTSRLSLLKSILSFYFGICFAVGLVGIVLGLL